MMRKPKINKNIRIIKNINSKRKLEKTLGGKTVGQIPCWIYSRKSVLCCGLVSGNFL